jgi:hypothetical protein
MTARQQQDHTLEHEPREPSAAAAQIASVTNTLPQSFDGGSIFTRQALQKTQLLELPAELRTQLIGDHGAKQPSPIAAPAGLDQQKTAVLDARALDQALQHERSMLASVPPVERLAQMDATATVYDGGALREHALKLAQELVLPQAREVTPVPADGGAARPLVTAKLTVYARLRSRVGAAAGAWRQASLVRRLIALLLPVAALATLWPDEEARAGSPGPAPRVSDGKAVPPPRPIGGMSPAPSAEQALEPEGASRDVSNPTLAEPTPAQRLVEAQALKAAFSGDTATAARHYERLARELKDPRFELAVRLVRTDGMRRP